MLLRGLHLHGCRSRDLHRQRWCSARSRNKLQRRDLRGLTHADAHAYAYGDPDTHANAHALTYADSHGNANHRRHHRLPLERSRQRWLPRYE